MDDKQNGAFVCPVCHNEGWICADHPNQPAAHDACRAEGAPCPVCFPLGGYPGIPKGAVILAEIGLDGGVLDDGP